MAGRITDTTPKQDGYRMPGEFEPQERIYMIWPERTDNWRDGAKPAQEAYTNVAKAISRFYSGDNAGKQQAVCKCQSASPGEYPGD